MSVEQIEHTLLQLPPEDRRRFVDWFYQHEDELIGTATEDIRPEVKAEILRRRDEVMANPELMEAWDGTMDEARKRLNEIRRQKAESR